MAIVLAILNIWRIYRHQFKCTQLIIHKVQLFFFHFNSYIQIWSPSFIIITGQRPVLNKHSHISDKPHVVNTSHNVQTNDLVILIKRSEPCKNIYTHVCGYIDLNIYFQMMFHVPWNQEHSLKVVIPIKTPYIILRIANFDELVPILQRIIRLWFNSCKHICHFYIWNDLIMSEFSKSR